MKARYLPFLSFVACLVVLVAAHFFFGFTLGGDTERYLERGNDLMLGLSGDGFQRVKFDEYTVLYLLPNIAFGYMDLIWGPHAVYVSIVMNMVFYSFSTLLIFRIWVGSSADKTSFLVLISGLYLILGLPAEVVKWNFVAFSPDIFFIPLLSAFWLFLSSALTRGTASGWVGAGVVSILCVATKPAGIVVPVFLGVIIAYLRMIRKGRDSALINWIAWSALFILPTAVVFLLWPYIVYLDRFDIAWIGYLADNLQWLFGAYQKGIVVKGIPETHVGDPGTYWEYVTVGLYRLVYFVLLWRPGYSVIHVVLNVVYSLVLIWASIVGWRGLRRCGGVYAVMAPALLACSYYFALFYSVTIVDDWRYELPMWPPLWILAGYGALFRFGAFRTPPHPGVSGDHLRRNRRATGLQLAETHSVGAVAVLTEQGAPHVGTGQQVK